MNKKNIYILKTLLLLCATVAPSFYVISAPPGKRPLGYTGPKRAKPMPQKSIPAQSEPAPIQPTSPQTPQFKKVPAPIEEKELKETEEESSEVPEIFEAPETKKTTASQAKNIQTIAAPAPAGWLFGTYVAIAPIILGALNSAFATAIAAGTKTAIKQVMARNAFISLKKDVEKEATEIVESGAFDNLIEQSVVNYISKKSLEENSPEYMQKIKEAQDLIASPKEQKIAIQANAIFKQSKIGDPKEMEKATSLSSALGNVGQTLIVHGIISTIATLAGYGVTLGLQGLLPTQQQ